MNASNVREVLSREADFVEDDGSAAFWLTGPFDDGATWVGQFSGESPWERHPGDEFLYIVEGSVQVTLLPGDEKPATMTLGEGSFFVVPKNTWHRQFASNTVIEIGATPGRTGHSDLVDPRLGGE